MAARQAAKLGGRVLLLDRSSFPRRKVCGACLSERALTTLRSVGLTDIAHRLNVVPLHEFQVASPTGRLRIPLVDGLAVSRNKFDGLLVHSAIEAGAEFLTEVRAQVQLVRGNLRQVTLQFGSGKESQLVEIGARVVLAADGLGHPSLSHLPEFTHNADPASRIGAGCELQDFGPFFRPGAIHMAVGRHGYVGLVVLETGALNVAAAFDPHFVRTCGGLASAAEQILREAHFPEIPDLLHADWQGTPMLTRRPTRLAATRLFLLGDAASYIEPFTGEGMAWALDAAVEVAPLVRKGWILWNHRLEQEWTRKFTRKIGREQQWCWLLAQVLRRPWCVRILLRGFLAMPTLSNWLVKWTRAPKHRNMTNSDLPSESVDVVTKSNH